MTTFFVILLIVFPIVAIIVWLRRKEAARLADLAKKESEFLAAMRANPTAAAAPATPAPVAPLIVGSALRQPVDAAPASTAPGQGGLPRNLPVEPIPAYTPAEIARPPTAPPKDGHCLVCGEGVDMRSNDAGKWGVKIPEPGADRLIWVHFHCLAVRLEEGRALREAIGKLTAAVDAIDAEAGAATSVSALQAFLAKARALVDTSRR